VFQALSSDGGALGSALRWGSDGLILQLRIAYVYESGLSSLDGVLLAADFFPPVETACRAAGMALVSRPHPPALPHGAIREVLPGIHLVNGTVRMAMPPLSFSRNMTILRDGERLVLVNCVRLDEAGLASLDALGTVTDVIRLAGGHGMDDPFYRERYGAKVWAVAGQRYTAGADDRARDVYLEPDVAMAPGTELPVPGARLYTIRSTPPDALLVLDRQGGTVVAGDSLQNWVRPDNHFNLLARMLMPLMGFVRPYNIGPAWLKDCKPPPDDLRGILALDFANVLPAHGEAVIGGARDHYRSAIERVSSG